MGFLGPEKYIATELNTTMDERGNFKTSVDKYKTSLNGVYAAGGKLLIINFDFLTIIHRLLTYCRYSTQIVGVGSLW